MKVRALWGWAAGADPADAATVIAEAMAAGNHDALIGEFAAVVDDGTEVLLVRDPLGAVPLHFGWADGELVADADLAFVRDRCWRGGLDADILDRMQLQAPAPEHRTVFPGVLQVPPGTIVRIRERRIRVERYFVPATLRPRRMSVAEAKESLRAALQSAVADAIGSSGAAPIAAHVSGGLDSSMVAALAQRELRAQSRRLETGFSWIGADVTSASGEPTELTPANQVAEALGVPLECITGSDLAKSWLIGADPLLFPAWGTPTYEAVVAERAHRAGVGVILSGWGGDEYASSGGRQPYGWHLRGGQVGVALTQPRAETAVHRRGLVGAVGSALLAPGRSRWGRATREPVRDWRERNPQAHREYLRLFRPGAPPHVRQRLLLQLGYLQRRMAVWWLIGRRFGVQYRYPLLDRRVVVAARQLPPSMFRRNGHSRWIVRELLREVLPGTAFAGKREPDRVRHHQQYFTANLDRWADYYPDVDRPGRWPT